MSRPQLIPEELEETADAAIAHGIVGVKLCGIVVLGWFAVLNCVHTLVDILHAFGKGWGAEQGIDEALFEEVEPRHRCRGAGCGVANRILEVD